MAERQPVGAGHHIEPKDVFGRSNMPSRWERLTGVSPKIPEDRTFLSFVAARYRGETRLPRRCGTAGSPAGRSGWPPTNWPPGTCPEALRGLRGQGDQPRSHQVGPLVDDEVAGIDRFERVVVGLGGVRRGQ